MTQKVLDLMQASAPTPASAPDANAASPPQEPPPPPAPPPPDASAAPVPEINLPYFQSQLGPYGVWVDLPPYGPVWRPGIAMNDPSWRPYSQGGHWVMTDAGWYWQADDPWGAIVFHYGRWFFDTDNGWVWVPGYNWAPSWVAWRRSDNFYGWAPLPPQAEFVAGVGISIGGVAVAADFDFGLHADAFTFVGCDHIFEHDYAAVMLPSARVDVVFRASIVQNSYRLDGGRFVVEGFGRNDLAVRVGHPVEVVSINKQVVVEHTTVVNNVTSVKNVTIRNNVTKVRNVSNVSNVSNVRNVNTMHNVNNVNNVSNTKNVTNAKDVSNMHNVNNTHNVNNEANVRNEANLHNTANVSRAHTATGAANVSHNAASPYPGGTISQHPGATGATQHPAVYESPQHPVAPVTAQHPGAAPVAAKKTATPAQGHVTNAPPR